MSSKFDTVAEEASIPLVIPSEKRRDQLTLSLLILLWCNPTQGSELHRSLVVRSRMRAISALDPGEIEFIDLHRDPYTNKCKAGGQSRKSMSAAVECKS